MHREFSAMLDEGRGKKALAQRKKATRGVALYGEKLKNERQAVATR